MKRILGLAVLAAACDAAEGGPERSQPPAPVEVATVEHRDFADEIVALGSLRARESVELTANVTEKVARVSFVDGQTVRAGQVMVELVRQEELSLLERARADLDQAQSELGRVEKLAAENIATASELDRQRNQTQGAQASLKTIEAQLGDRLVRAPFDGVVGLRRVSPGALVTPATVIATFDAIDRLYADLPIPERYLSKVAPGQAVSLHSDAFEGSAFEGKVVAFDGRVDPATRSVAVRAEIDNPEAKLRPGMLVRARLLVGTRSSPAVPEAALVQRASRAFVYVVNEENDAQQVQVQVGRRQPGWVEITDGLGGGERVIVRGTNRVRPGAKVTLAE